MTMAFETVRDALIQTLGYNAAGNFRVVGYQRKATSAEEELDNLRSAQVFFAGSDYPKSAGRYTGPIQGDLQFRVDLTAAKAAQGSIGDIANFEAAAYLADRSWDQFYALVWNILLNGLNEHLGLDLGEMSSRWIDRVEKGDPAPQGEYAIVTGTFVYSCRVCEEPGGDVGLPGDSLDTEIEVNQDPTAKTGAEV